MDKDYNLIISLISLGFFGGFSHCVGMCGPFVLTQVGNRLQKTPIDKFSNFKKLQNFALLPYHLGRITTYSIMGFFSSFITKNLRDVFGFKVISVVFLSLAILFFLNILFPFLSFPLLSSPRRRGSIPRSSHRWIQACVNAFVGMTKGRALITTIKKTLFQNPTGLNGYILGLLLGFIPCGLLYGAFLIAAAMPSPIFAAVGMFLFGITTFPALFLSGIGSYAFFKFEIAKLQLLFKITSGINIIIILMMIYKIIYYV